MAAEVDGQMVLLDVEKGQYFGLNEVGLVIWRRLEKPATVAELSEAVMEEFEVETSQCEQDVIVLLRELKEHGLVQLVGPEIESGA